MRGTRPIETQRPPHGMTLIELLVVIVLLTTLVSTAIPIISPGGDERKIREASRSVNAYLQGAQARAIQTGRPYGVAFRRLSADTDNAEHNAVCAQLRYVEVPPAYAGLDSSSSARVCAARDANGQTRLALQLVRNGTTSETSDDRLPPGYDPELVPDGFFRHGDLVELGDALYAIQLPDRPFFGAATAQLPLFQPYPDGATNAGYFRSLNDNAAGYCFEIEPVNNVSASLRFVYNWAGNEMGSPEEMVASPTQPNTFSYLSTPPAPYKIYRQPTLAGGEPLELPAGVAIDLQASVSASERVYPLEYDFDGSNFRLRNTDFMVLFSPEGHVHRVHGLLERNPQSGQVELATPQPLTGNIALLIGRRELIPARPLPTSDYTNPFPIDVDDYNALLETEAREVTDQYNWLNLQSQWVVVGGQSGSVTSIDNSAVYPSEADTNNDGDVNFAEQVTAALENAPRRSVSGGR